ncbi:MAG: hypothetical protein ETSY2_00740 [Candidatus Entotheonella gemina]|uniref:Solute-binding protein family 3/N-terminal domain-containing protein n=1 Tax=Candidatus Entotheonella gemina TaxID=1429439 RepID=W4MG98_9BACT|nr:MAG: hypothetical protein ETSY2_00740 [Candidatus Entotheonella gemina]
MRQTIRVIVIWSLIALAAAESSRSEERLPFSDLQRLFARNTLVVAILHYDYPPLFTTSESGRLSGSDISLIENLARELGVAVEFDRQAKSFDEIIDRVSQGQADLGLGTTLTLSRAKRVLFSKPYMTLNIALLLNRVKLLEAGIRSTLKDVQQLRHTSQKIGLLAGSAYLDYARKSFPKAELKEYAALPELLAATEQGELLAAVRNDLTAQLYLLRHPASIVRLQLFVDRAAKDYVAFSIRPDSPHVLSWVNTYLFVHQIDLDAGAVMKQYRGGSKPK